MQNKESIKLDVPSYRQTENYTCVPSCCKMMLDYLNHKKLKIPESTLDENQIAKIMNTTVSGTIFYEVENINKVMIKSDPSIEFRAEFKHHTLDDIRKELRKELSVSVWISTGSVDFLHSIVITGIDDMKKIIFYNDPIYGMKIINQSEFVTKWEKGNALMIKTEIGRINRYTLDYFPKEKDDEKS